MGKTSELLSLLKTGNSDAARRLIAKFKKAGKKKALAKELNVPDDNGQTVIHFCAAQNFVEFLQDLAELGASVDMADNKGYTPLHLAAASGRTSAVAHLIRMGADPNISSRTGDTAIHLACYNGHATSVETLVKENANCTMLNVSGYTPLDLACQSGHAQVVSLLLYSGQFSATYLQRSDMPHTALMLAAKQGHNDCIALLLKHGFDLNRKLPGSNGGTTLHEAALHGRVDTVRYLIQCGADVQKTNTQGHTALDIVNMYTDPKTAGLMKQVLQDALAQLARSRIAQQHASGHQTAASFHNPPAMQQQQQPAGFSYFPSSGQQMVERQRSEEQRHHPMHSQRQTSHQPTVHSYSQVPQGHQSNERQSYQTGGGGGHPYPTHSTSRHHSQQDNSLTNPQQQMNQKPSHHAVQPSPRAIQPSAAPPAIQSQLSHDHHHHHHHHHHHQQQQQQQQQQPQQQGQQQQQQQRPQPQLQKQEYTTHDVPLQPPPQNVQHIYPKPGTPEAVRKTQGFGGDLAAIIAAKAANRKPISIQAGNESLEVANDQFSRSATVSGEPAMQQARVSVQRRRSSMSDRSSASPERGDILNPPTLPRRAPAGPPSFKPAPPPSDFPRGRGSGEIESRGPLLESERQVPSKPQHPTSAPNQLAEENELLAKLKRRQNKIIEAEQEANENVVAESVEKEMVKEQNTEEEPAQSKPPPPPPQRKTPALHPAPQSVAASQDDVVPVTDVAKQRKVKPPPPKPKEPEPEMTPWQQELARRKARMADYEKEVEPDIASQVIEKAPSPVPLPKPAPKPKRTKPTPPLPDQDHVRPSHSITNRQEGSSVVPTVTPQTEPSEKQQPPVPQSVTTVFRPTVVPEELLPPPPPPPPEMANLVPSNADQLSRSTSLSSLTTATGSPQLSHAEHMPVLEWLRSHKLGDYAPVLEGNGYGTTELMIGLTHEELQEMGIAKIGHRKKLIAGLASWPQRDNFFQGKPESVSEWLRVLQMSQYEETLIEAGYDDLDFISDMTLDDLQDIGINKRGHVKRLLQGIGELTDIIKSSPSHFAPENQHLPPAQPTSEANNDIPVTVPIEEDLVLPPPPLESWYNKGDDHSTEKKVDFSRMKGLLEKKMGANRVMEERVDSSSHVSSHPPPPIPPHIPPRRTFPTEEGRDELDTGKSYSVEDITAALEEQPPPTEANEFDKLNSALTGLTESNAEATEPTEPEPDQLLADIDDMLADLTTHLDFMIPG